MSRKREEKKYHPLDLQKNVGVGIPLPIGGTPIFAYYIHDRRTGDI